MFLNPAIVAAFTLASSTFASLTTAADPDQLAKRFDGTCRIIKDSLWHYIVTIPGDGHPGCGGALLDNIRGTGYQPQNWGAGPLSNGGCETSFALPAGSADAVNRGFQAAFGGTAGC
ncbi:hypothetical protein B0H67DRAFT_650116 [Lasiosphaeris hirsuta]|uniref:Small secreted protein n=1 Tax=Lasiosphaeris hirsuta TaxID=260670 RepID=A0AA40DGY2_9PEZI|nr:hypothetical protein B0H67DRAFT_650116 [Lasiosphaeris hirsuta]